MSKIKKFTVQFLEDNQKSKKGEVFEVSADSKKQAIKKACKMAGYPYPSPYFSLVSEKKDVPKQKPESKPKSD